MKTRIIAVTESTGPIEMPKHFAGPLRRADDHIKLAVSAAEKIWDQDPQRGVKTGLFVGTAFGPMQTNFDVLGLIIDENQTSPTLFSHSVFNSAAGYIARLFNISGGSFSFTDFSFPFFQALAQGYDAIASGRLDRCLVLQVETYSRLLQDAKERTGKDPEPWPQGVVAWHLAAEGEGTGYALGNVAAETVPAPPSAFLHREEILTCNGQTISCSTPLSAPAAVTKLIADTRPGRPLNCNLTAPYGAVTLTLQPV